LRVFKAMGLENNVTHKNNQKASLFSRCGALLPDRISISSPSSIVEDTRRQTTARGAFDSGKKHGFGTEENDWMGAEAYVDTLR